jgi:hypothetical protein
LNKEVHLFDLPSDLSWIPVDVPFMLPNLVRDFYVGAVGRELFVRDPLLGPVLEQVGHD